MDSKAITKIVLLLVGQILMWVGVPVDDETTKALEPAIGGVVTAAPIVWHLIESKKDKPNA